MILSRDIPSFVVAAVGLTMCSWAASIYLPLFFELDLTSGKAILLSNALLAAALAGPLLGVALGVTGPGTPVLVVCAAALTAVTLRVAFTIYAVGHVPLWSEGLELVSVAVLFVCGVLLGRRVGRTPGTDLVLAGYVLLGTLLVVGCAFVFFPIVPAWLLNWPIG